MFNLDYVTPEKATGTVKAVYDLFPEGTPVPAPLRLYSTSPRYLKKQAEFMGIYLKDDAYSTELLAALRYIGASTQCFEACTLFNRDFLMRMGLSEDEVTSLTKNPAGSFEKKEAAMLAFATKSVTDPDGVTEEDIDTVRAQGWTDQQIFECTAYAANMATIGIVYRTFAR